MSFEGWSTDQVIQWLGETNSVLKNKYEKAFRDEGVDGKMLTYLEDSTLEEDLGVTSKIHRKRLLDAIGELTSRKKARTEETKVDEKAHGDDEDGDKAIKDTKEEADVEDAEASVPAETRSKEVEICFSFDTTGSMYPCLGQVKNKIKSLVERLLRDVPHMKIALIAHGDYQDEGETYLMKKCNFSCDAEILTKWVADVGSTCGYDGDEAYEYVLRESQSLAWSPTCTRRALVMIGDANPHTTKNNKYNIDWKKEAKNLSKMDVRIHGVHALGYKHSRGFYEQMAQLTGGLYLELSQFSSIRDLILGIAFAEDGNMEQLGAFEEEVQRGGRMNRAMRRVFSRLQNREEETDVAGLDGLTAVEAGRFQVLDVEEKVPIKVFAQAQGLIFKAGKGFYEFTKPEKISMKKEIVLQKKDTGDFYSGDHARELIGVSEESANRKIKPSDFADYVVFVQSTSYNRVLMPGTKFLYEVDSDH